MLSFFRSNSSSPTNTVTEFTRFQNCEELKQLFPVLSEFRAQEKKLEKAAKKAGVGTATFEKHIVVQALLNALDELIAEFNHSTPHVNYDKELEAIFILIRKMKESIDYVLREHHRHLMHIRGINPKVINEFLYIGSISTALVTAVYLPLSFLRGVFAIVGAGVASTEVGNFFQLQNYEPKSMQIIKSLSKTINLIHAGLNLYTHRESLAQTKSLKSNDLLFTYSDATQSYLDSFEKKQKNTDIIAKLKLSKEEESLFEIFIDPITNEIMNRPVLLNSVVYDLDTILHFDRKENGYSEDPYTKFKFYPRDIQSARNVQKALETMVENVVQQRKNSNVSRETKPSL